MAQPVLFAPIDPLASITEVGRVRDEGVALVARAEGHLVGALGLVKTAWWYAPKTHFLTDRWFFILPAFQNAGVGAKLLAEAAAIGAESGLDIIINGHLRRRGKAVGRGVVFTKPTVIARPRAA